MNIIQGLLSIPTYLLLVLLIFFFAGINVIITYFTRRYMRRKIGNPYNEFTGYIFSVVAGFHALLLAFVVVQALGESNDVQKDADREGSLARSLYRQIKYYPDSSDASVLKKEYLNYVSLVVREEYPNLAKMKKSDATVNSFSKVFEMIERLNPAEHNIQSKAQLMLKDMNELAIYRSLRILAGDSKIPLVMWVSLLLGGFINSILAALFNVENQRYHLFLNGLMGAFIALLFFLIILLDHPFAGSIKVKPTGYGMIISMEEASNLKK